LITLVLVMGVLWFAGKSIAEKLAKEDSSTG
jgi:hypothetical protein